MPTIIPDCRKLPKLPPLKLIQFCNVMLIVCCRYTQGMSDLLAPVLCEVQNESETFWCFVGLMQRAIFVCTPTDNDIDKNLV